MKLDPRDFITAVAFEERWTLEDRARAKALIGELERNGVDELRLIPPDGLEARAPGHRGMMSPVALGVAKPILEGLESLAERLASRPD